MRAISLVNRLEFNFSGNVVRKALTLGDVDNDNCIELVVGSESGEVAIFKGNEKLQTIKNLGFVSCVAVGDILNMKQNCLVIVSADGWCYIYRKGGDDINGDGVEEVDGQVLSGETMESEKFSDITLDEASKNCLTRIHSQKIPPNSKDILLGDIDGDGCVEMVVGLTDRVVRSYRWFACPVNSDLIPPLLGPSASTGKLVCLNKWECANQIGSITLHHGPDGFPALLVAQPGGTFMRIRCQLEKGDTFESDRLSDSGSENLVGSSVDYQFLGLSRMRNQNISTEILGDLKTSCDEQRLGEIELGPGEGRCSTSGVEKGNMICKGRPYAVATLDGTIMLVQDEIILWAIAVDHQVFALTKLDVTGNGVDDIVACSWDGQTYILDQDKNSVRIQLDESVQAFDSGYYTLAPGDSPVTCLVYVTFRNKIYLYYDIPLKEMISRKFEPDFTKLRDLLGDEKSDLENLDRNAKKELVEYLLYGVGCDEK